MNTKHAPPGWVRSSHRRPPWFSMIERLMARPYPSPSGLVEKKASKSFQPRSRADAGAAVADCDAHAAGGFGANNDRQRAGVGRRVAQGVHRIDEMRLRMTCCKRTASAVKAGGGVGRWTHPHAVVGEHRLEHLQQLVQQAGDGMGSRRKRRRAGTCGCARSPRRRGWRRRLTRRSAAATSSRLGVGEGQPAQGGLAVGDDGGGG